MSASEKLKALEAEYDDEDSAYWLGRKMQKELLPQIIAVVEAAEAFRAVKPYGWSMEEV